MNNLGELKLLVWKERIAAPRNSAELVAAEDKSGKEFAITGGSIDADCSTFAVRRVKVQDAAGRAMWSDDFSSDSTARYQWTAHPVGAPDALGCGVGMAGRMERC